MSGTTRVRLTTARRFPKHSNRPAKSTPGLWPLWRGKTIEVCLPPETPDEHWKCGTPVVWRVADSTVAEVGVEYVAAPYVCIHQIEAD
jgi:hypothetical protein